MRDAETLVARDARYASRMGVKTGPSEGGSGGKRGHRNMEHWGFTDEVKEFARRRRRLDDRLLARSELDEWSAATPDDDSRTDS